MHIREIEIDNFKSFKTKTVIPFLDGFTTVSGPNGSGKSNIVDSVLFALGLSTSRTLRAEKLTDLINNQSSRREASVKITFAADKEVEQEFTIRRRVKEGNNGYTSTFYINDKVSTLTEVHQKLSEYNISPGCYNVMMQGDVTGIINMSPFERRKIIDELAGVTEFDRRIDQANKELETVHDRIERSNIILGEIDVRLEQLSEERKLALKYQKLKDERQTYINQTLLVKYADFRKSFKLVQQNINESTKEKAEAKEQLGGLDEKIAAKTEELNVLNEKVKKKGEDEQIALAKQVEGLKGDIYRKEQSIEFAQKQIQENNLNSQKAGQETKKLLENIDDINLRIENRQDQYKIIEQQIEKENAELKRLIEESSDLTQATQGLIEKRNELRKKLEHAEDEHGRLSRESLKWQDIITRLEEEKKELADVINNSDTQKAQLEDKKNAFTNQLKLLEEEKEACEIQLKNTLAETAQLKDEISALEEKIQAKYRNLMRLEANKSAAEEVHFGKAVDAVLGAGIPGVHKTLAQLGRVDKEYSVAMEIAMGNRMRCIVVDDEHVGSQAIKFLKQVHAGRATFLPLTKMPYYMPGNPVPDYDGVIDFAINLIEFDDLYKDVFFYALGTTLIVESIEKARPLMGQYRMVTLDGSLIEKSGAMTGGSINTKGGVKFASWYDDEIKELSAVVKSLNQEKRELVADLDKLERKVDRCRNDYTGYLNKIHQKKLELENFDTTLSDIKNNFASRVERLEEVKSKITEAELENHSIQDELSEVDQHVQTLKAEIETVDSSIPKDKLQEIQELSGSIEFEIKNLEAKLRNLDAEIKKSSMEKDFKFQSIQLQKETIEKAKTDNAELEKKIATDKDEIITLRSNIEQLMVKLDALSTELKEIQKERDTVSKDLLKLQNTKDKHENTIQRIEEMIISYKARKSELNAQINTLRKTLEEQNIDYSDADNVTITTEEINAAIEKLSRRMESLEPVNMLAIKEYDDVNARKEELSDRITTLTNEKEEIFNRLSGYENLKKQSFMMTFENVNKNFVQIFEKLSDGEGHLVLENFDDPFKGGLTIEARPRGKKLIRLEAMSGGEKSLTALAFVFAFQRYMPAPFYAFDEVDMFLDGINAEKLSQMVKEQSDNAQFIVVSLRKPMLERADRTVGVTQRNDGVSRVTGVRVNG